MSTDHDWDAIEHYFVTRTPASLSLRDFSDLTLELAETNHTFINYQAIKDVAKVRSWHTKRSKFLIEKFPGLYTDAEVIYYMLRDKLVEQGDILEGSDMTRLAREMREYLNVLRDREVVLEETDSQDENRVTRDDFVQLIHQHVGRPEKSAFVDKAIEAIKAEDASADA